MHLFLLQIRVYLIVFFILSFPESSFPMASRNTHLVESDYPVCSTMSVAANESAQFTALIDKKKYTGTQIKTRDDGTQFEQSGNFYEGKESMHKITRVVYDAVFRRKSDTKALELPTDYPLAQKQGVLFLEIVYLPNQDPEFKSGEEVKISGDFEIHRGKFTESIAVGCKVSK